jgi:hypothetical protein
VLDPVPTDLKDQVDSIHTAAILKASTPATTVPGTDRDLSNEADPDTPGLLETGLEKSPTLQLS